MASACAYLHRSVLFKGGCPPSPISLGRQSVSALLHVTHGRLLFAGFSWLEMIARCDADVMLLTGGFDGSHVPVDYIR